MALLFLDGFDKYGGANSNTTSVAALMAGEWTTITNATIVAPLSATGQAISSTLALTLTKTLSGSVGRIIGGVRFNSTLANTAGVQFLDSGSNQCGIGIASTGVISLRNGGYTAGTILGSGATPISANTTHYLEWDITLGNAAAYNVYLDGVSIISGTGDTTATANNTVNGVSLSSATGVITYDDFYVFDTTGTTNNAVLLSSPRIETQLPNADSSVQFSIGASVLGGTVARSATAVNASPNEFYVRPFIAARACMLNSITLMGGTASSATSNFRPIIYADNAGVPGTLMSGGSTVLGIAANTALTMPLTTPQSLTAGTQYWLGFMTDASVASIFITGDATAQGRTASSTFASGAPGTAPATSAGQTTVLLWGNITLASAVNFYEVNQQPPPGVASYVYSSTPAQEDLYNFPALSTPGAVIHSVAVKSFAQKSDAGTRTMSLRTKSGATDSGGSLTGQALGTSFQWYGSFFPVDPNTSAAWTVANLNLATGGVRVDS